MMTECERLVFEGRIDRSFFREETREEYLVSTKLKKIWAIELDLLKQFDRMCSKYDLQYFLHGGTLLGAVRHKGFIPWDDDVDVFMKRNDFEKMLTHASEFLYPYFLQTPETDNSGYLYAKLRNSNTTCLITKFAFEENFNHGIFIDIFPLDDWNRENEGEKRIDSILNLAFENGTIMRKSNANLCIEDFERVKRISSDKTPLDNYIKAKKILMEDNGADCNEYIHATFILNRKALIFPKWCFQKVKYLLFEDLFCPVPFDFDEVLKIQYGDYMRLPDIEKRRTVHNGAIFEPDMGYKEFINEYYKKM